MPLSIHGDDHLPQLNSPNLRALDSKTASDRSHLLRAFVRSQEAHLSGYALEGKSLVSSWGRDTGDVVDNPPPRTKRRRDVELESGFGTPILKPRAHVREFQSTVPVSDKPATSERGSLSPQKKGKEPVQDTRCITTSSKTAKENVQIIRRETGEEEGRVLKRLRQSDAQELAQPQPPARQNASKSHKQKDLQEKPTRKSERTGEVDQEHKDRLAERRERRRAKKAIVEPRPAPRDSKSSEEDDLPPGKGTKRINKKGKGLNIPAGLALMHGFSAKNIGKNRLTLNPNSVVGVFNKGKASAKASVKRLNATKPYLELFSEERFLSKVPQEITSSRVGRQRSDSDDSGTEEAGPQPQAKSTKTAEPKPSSKRKRLRSPSPTSTEQDEHATGASEAVQPPAKKARVAREASPVWDIELDDGQLPSGTVSGQSVHSGEEGSRACGTVLLATDVFTSRWENHRPKPEVARPAIEPSAHQTEVSSIAPSHSASQLASRQEGHEPAHERQREAFSRYFPVPTNARQCPEPRLAPAHQDSRSPEPPISLCLRQTVSPGPERPASDRAVSLQEDRLTSPSRSGLDDHFSASRQAPDIHVNCPRDPVSPLRVNAELPESPVLPAPFRSSSIPLPFGPGSPASPGRVTQDLGDLDRISRVVPRHEPVYVLAVSPDESMCAADWEADWAPTFLSDVDISGEIAGDGLEVCKVDELAIREHAYVTDSYILEEQALDLAMPSDSITPAYELEHIPDHQESACWERCQVTGAVEEGFCRFPRSDFVSVDVTDLETPCSDADVGAVDEYELRWPVDDAGHEGMQSTHNLFQGDLDDDYLPSEEGLASPGVAFAGGLESDDALQSEAEGDQSVLETLPRFSQGRALLMGVTDPGATGGLRGRAGVSRFEEDVVRSLRGHWLPQRF